MMVRPTFTIETPAADEDARRFISIDTIRTLTGIPETGNGAMSDEQLTLILDGVLSDCAEACNLAGFRGIPLTLAREECRAVWPAGLFPADYWARPFPTYLFADDARTQLILPWRAPITTIDVFEGETELVEDTDYRLMGAAVVQRLSQGTGTAWPWPWAGVRIDYTAGWIEDDDENPVPANLVQRIADQVKLVYFQRSQNQNLRSEDIPGIWSGSYNFAGGDTIEKDGLLRSLHAALARFKGPPVFA